MAAPGPAGAILAPGLAGTEVEAVARDPVCGTEVDEGRAPIRAVYQGTPYYFCSGECKARFDRDPARYVGRSGAARTEGSSARRP